MFTTPHALLFLLLIALTTRAQSTPDVNRFLENAQVKSDFGKVTLIANDPRPLVQAVEALRDHYHWSINYEDPVYRPSDMSGVKTKLVSSRKFVTTFEEVSGTDVQAEKHRVIAKVVSDYNLSSNAGHFAIRGDGPGGSPSVVGISAGTVETTPIFDTSISMKKQVRSAEESILEVLQQIELRTGIKVSLASGPIRRLKESQVEVGAENTEARKLLESVLWSAQGSRRLNYKLLYDPDLKHYYLNISVGD
jgi:hypothetical protein